MRTNIHILVYIYIYIYIYTQQRPEPRFSSLFNSLVCVCVCLCWCVSVRVYVGQQKHLSSDPEGLSNSSCCILSTIFRILLTSSSEGCISYQNFSQVRSIVILYSRLSGKMTLEKFWRHHFITSQFSSSLILYIQQRTDF